MKQKFLVKFVDAQTGRSQEQVVGARNAKKVREGFLSNLKQVLSIVAL